jgi:four helix bundle protein
MVEKIRSFQQLDAWKKAHALILDIYKVTRKFPAEELYGIVSQMKRAASSITANIAEGFSRYHYNDKVRFYLNARGSVSELQNFLFLSRDLSFIDEKIFAPLYATSEDVAKLINGMVRSIEKQK